MARVSESQLPTRPISQSIGGTSHCFRTRPGCSVTPSLTSAVGSRANRNYHCLNLWPFPRLDVLCLPMSFGVYVMSTVFSDSSSCLHPVPSQTAVTVVQTQGRPEPGSGPPCQQHLSVSSPVHSQGHMSNNARPLMSVGLLGECFSLFTCFHS